ncbi:VOC family protein [uncultured Roseovarius sp.]|uniref:VOC family protein n=1 Tax=uncultured Roseovarius sp. TaxID=293344 RepID=UPI0026290971|nr:VOC family protein [uncultured Roseovarius sp.]
MLELDHLAIAAENLEDGRAHVEDALKVKLQPGGQHAHFGTHNLLLDLDDGLYLEVIAIDPEAPAPGYPRWFDLDRFLGPPKLTNWICRTNALAEALQSFPQSGSPVALVRGDLRWQMAVPEDGILPFGGMFPALIEWQGDAHPVQRLQASGCHLDRLVVSHPEISQLSADLTPLLSEERVVYEVGEVGLRAEIVTPDGIRVLA